VGRIGTFWTNPQFRVTVIDADEGDDDNTGSLIVALLQRERRSTGSELLTIGYAIYKVSGSIAPCSNRKTVLD